MMAVSWAHDVIHDDVTLQAYPLCHGLVGSVSHITEYWSQGWSLKMAVVYTHPAMIDFVQVDQRLFFK